MKIGVTCESCGGDSCKVLESRPITRTVRRRRWICLTCNHRWTIYTNKKGETVKSPPKNKPYSQQRPRTGRKLKHDEVKFILTTEFNNKDLGERFNLSRETIRLIRIGSIYKDVHPDIPRLKPKPSIKPSCRKCVNWKGRCLMDIPDPVVEGVRFAKDCIFYEVLHAEPSSILDIQ